MLYFYQVTAQYYNYYFV